MLEGLFFCAFHHKIFFAMRLELGPKLVKAFLKKKGKGKGNLKNSTKKKKNTFFAFLKF